jgi:hypothetical protein
VLSSTYTQPFAINTFDDGYSVYDSITFVNYDFIGDRVVVGQGANQEELMKRARAVLQAASEDLDKR